MAVWFVAAATVLLAVAGSQGNALPQDVSLIGELIRPRESCTAIGKLSCSSDCSKVMICFGNTLEEFKTCPPNTMCDVATGKFSADVTVCDAVDKDTFTCHGPVGGRFPNPYDCHSYFTCPDPPATTVAPRTTEAGSAVESLLLLDSSTRLVPGVKTECPTGTAYDPLSTTCRFRENHRVCTEGPVPECKASLQSGPLVENGNIYYVCVGSEGSLVPWLAKCSDPTAVFQDAKCVSLYLRRQ